MINLWYLISVSQHRRSYQGGKKINPSKQINKIVVSQGRLGWAVTRLQMGNVLWFYYVWHTDFPLMDLRSAWLDLKHSAVENWWQFDSVDDGICLAFCWMRGLWGKVRQLIFRLCLFFFVFFLVCIPFQLLTYCSRNQLAAHHRGDNSDRNCVVPLSYFPHIERFRYHRASRSTAINCSVFPVLEK